MICPQVSHQLIRVSATLPLRRVPCHFAKWYLLLFYLYEQLPYLFPFVNHGEGVFPKKMVAYAVRHTQYETLFIEHLRTMPNFPPNGFGTTPTQQSRCAYARPGASFSMEDLMPPFERALAEMGLPALYAIESNGGDFLQERLHP